MSIQLLTPIPSIQDSLLSHWRTMGGPSSLKNKMPMNSSIHCLPQLMKKSVQRVSLWMAYQLEKPLQIPLSQILPHLSHLRATWLVSFVA